MSSLEHQQEDSLAVNSTAETISLEAHQKDESDEKSVLKIEISDEVIGDAQHSADSEEDDDDDEEELDLERTPSTLTHSNAGTPCRSGNRGSWTAEEDEILKKAVSEFGGKNWKKIAEQIPQRTDVQCLHRWQKVLRPGLIKGPWTPEVCRMLQSI